MEIEYIKDMIEVYRSESQKVFATTDSDNSCMCQIMQLIYDAYENEQTIFVCGNGGSASAAEHFATDLNIHPFVSDDKAVACNSKKRFHCVDLCASSSTLTALTNDLGPDYIFSAQLLAHAKQGDLLICFSGSGNSKNIAAALAMKQQLGIKCIGVTKNDKSKLAEHSDMFIHVKGDSKFPGQVGGNNNNFHFEDYIMKFTHMIVGFAKQYVQSN